MVIILILMIMTNNESNDNNDNNNSCNNSDKSSSCTYSMSSIAIASMWKNKSDTRQDTDLTSLYTG